MFVRTGSQWELILGRTTNVSERAPRGCKGNWVPKGLGSGEKQKKGKEETVSAEPSGEYSVPLNEGLFTQNRSDIIADARNKDVFNWSNVSSGKEALRWTFVLSSEDHFCEANKSTKIYEGYATAIWHVYTCHFGLIPVTRSLCFPHGLPNWSKALGTRVLLSP